MEPKWTPKDITSKKPFVIIKTQMGDGSFLCTFNE
jgi:hypothetical protein